MTPPDSSSPREREKTIGETMHLLMVADAKALDDDELELLRENITYAHKTEAEIARWVARYLPTAVARCVATIDSLRAYCAKLERDNDIGAGLACSRQDKNDREFIALQSRLEAAERDLKEEEELLSHWQTEAANWQEAAERNFNNLTAANSELSRLQGQLVEARGKALEDAAAAVGFGPQPPKPLDTEQRDWFLKQFRALNQAVTCGSHENSQR